MIFKKAERRRLPLCAVLVVGGLAAIGFCSIKRRGSEMYAKLSSKIKHLGAKREKDSDACSFD